ncbi:MAG: protein arginine kinase [Clostridia bacterium]
MSKYDDIVITTRVRLARNINELPFPHKLTGQEEEIYSILYKNIEEVCKKMFKVNFFKMNKLSEIEKVALTEKHLISKELMQKNDIGAVAISEDESISVMINEEDHIRAQCVLKGLNLESAYDVINKLDDLLNEKINYAYDNELGYLTSCPTNLGTGMRASVMLFLPALTITGNISNIINNAQKAGITTRGVYGEGSEAEGYFYQISNQASLGLNEIEILNRVKNVVTNICETEIIEREKLIKLSKVEIQDSIMRAFGILTHARTITSSECLGLLAKVKLGVSYELLDVPNDLINNLYTLIHPANLCLISKKALEVKDRDIIRAKLVREKLLPYENGGKK